jgi:DNA-binding beta-propeller fold protein YncE
MKRLTTLTVVLFLAVSSSPAQGKAPLRLVETIPLPGLHDGDFDHFAVDLSGHRLFLTAEENSAVEVFDTDANKLIHTITDVKAPHSLLYRDDLKKLFVVDGDLEDVKIYDAETYKPAGEVKLTADADSMAYDPATKYLYVVNGGRGTHESFSRISIVDTTNATKLGDIKVDSNRVEAMAIEKSGPHLFCNITGNNAVGVIDREKRSVVDTWSIAEVGKQNVAMAFDEAGHRLFVVTRQPGKLIVLDSNSGKVIASLPCTSMADDAVYDPELKRIYVAGTEFVDVFEQKDSDHYGLLGRVPGSFRAKTALLVPELHRYYLAVPHHEKQSAEVRVYEVVP